MDMNEPYPIEITTLISAFVDRVEQVLLKRGTPRAERTSICQEVETQIHMLIERRIESGAELNIDLVNGIIESMDQPDSYAPETSPLADGLLTGQRIASIGVLMLPFLLVNALLIAILFATPFGIVLGVLTVVALLIYGNYYFLQKALRWLSIYSINTAKADSVKPEVMADNGVLSGVANL